MRARRGFVIAFVVIEAGCVSEPLSDDAEPVRSAASVFENRTPAPAVAVTPPASDVPTGQPADTGPGIVRLIGCDGRGETVTIANVGAEAISLDGFELHDEGRNHSRELGDFGSLAPGEELRILTGEDAVAQDGDVVWKQQNVWNNDGDTAHLIGFGVEQTASC